MNDPAITSAVMRELASRRWRGQVATRAARTVADRVDELPEVERRSLIAALTEHAAQEQS
jgi:rRNA-processing protein FCF1